MMGKKRGLHFHTYQYGEKYEEEWRTLLNAERIEMSGTYNAPPPLYHHFARTYQDGVCSCGKIKRRRIR